MARTVDLFFRFEKVFGPVCDVLNRIGECVLCLVYCYYPRFALLLFVVSLALPAFAECCTVSLCEIVGCGAAGAEFASRIRLAICLEIVVRKN